MYVDDWEYDPTTLELLTEIEKQPLYLTGVPRVLVHKRTTWMVTPARGQTIPLMSYINREIALGAAPLKPLVFASQKLLEEFLSDPIAGSVRALQASVRTIRNTPGQRKVLTLDELNGLLGALLDETLSTGGVEPEILFQMIMDVEVSREVQRTFRQFSILRQPLSFLGSEDPAESFWDDRHFATVTELKQLSLAEFRRTAAPTIIKQSDQDELRLPETTLRLMEDAENLLFLPDPQYQLVPEILWLTRGPAGYEGNYFLSEHTWIGDDIAWIAGRVAPVPADIEQFPSTGYLYELGLHRTPTKDPATRTLPLDVLAAVNQNA